MPFSFDPQPGEDETECARCGALFYYELTRCPQCGVNIYAPEDDLEEGEEDPLGRSSPLEALFAGVKDWVQRLLRKPYSAEDVFGDALDQALVYDDLLGKVGGDPSVVERLVAFEQGRMPSGSRITWLKNAVQRWERDNRIQGNSR